MNFLKNLKTKELLAALLITSVGALIVLSFFIPNNKEIEQSTISVSEDKLITNHEDEVIDTYYDFSDISTEDVYSIWDETSITTIVHQEAFRELERRRYFDGKRKKRENEAIEIFNKYK